MKPVCNILFVCLGNICRSTMAEFVLKDMIAKDGLADKIHIESAGTSTSEIGCDTHPGTKEVLRKHHIPFAPRQARQVRREDYDKFDFIIIMDDLNAAHLKPIIPKDPECKIHKLLSFIGEDRDVADPWYTDNFEKTYEDISTACKALKEFLYQKYRLV